MTRESVLTACREAILDAVTSQVRGDGSPRLIDAVPTSGKTTATAKLTPELASIGDGLTYLTHRVDNREQFSTKVREAADEPIQIHQLPSFFDDCPTARGDHGDDARKLVGRLYERGVSPGAIHSHPEVRLPCGDEDCPYVAAWDGHTRADVIVGHPAHAHLSQVLTGRVVVIDEDPGDAYRTDFTAESLNRAVSAYLESRDELPANTLRDVWRLVEAGPVSADRELVLDAVRSPERREAEDRVVGSDGLTGDRVSVELVLWALLVERDSSGESHEPVASETFPRSRELSNDVLSVHLDESTAVAYDDRTGTCAVRDAPSFGTSAAVVGLDGTPLASAWAGRLGLPESSLETERVLCDDCRSVYLCDEMGYEFARTTPYVKPYSAADRERMNRWKDRGLLHVVSQIADSRVGLITTKAAEDHLIEGDDGNVVAVEESDVAHYGEVKGSNEFQGEEFQYGVVIGSPHPGSGELRLLAGLDEIPYQSSREIVEAGHRHERTVPDEVSEPYLQNARDDRVAQAALRFGRTDGATVFLHTSALPDWLERCAASGFVDDRSEGQRAVMSALTEVEPAKTGEVADRVSVVGRNMVYRHLTSLADEGVVENVGDGSTARWRRSDTQASPTARVDLPGVAPTR